MALSGFAQSPDQSGCDRISSEVNCKLIDDFEADQPNTPPDRWRALSGGTPVPLTKGDMMTKRKNIYVRSEDGNQFGRIETDAKALRVAFPFKNSERTWHLDKRPMLRWRWRAKDLPEGANEKHSNANDTGGAVYVTLGTDWLGRPKSIKYTYSSSLPVGTSVDYGPLKVLVVASKKEQGLDKWVSHERNVIQDYKQLFGDTPKKTPFGIAIWSDSDTVGDTSTMDFDDLVLLSGPSPDR